MNIRKLIASAAAAAALAMAAAPVPAAIFTTLNAPANDNLSGAADVNDFIYPSFQTVRFDIDTSGATGEANEPYGYELPGSLWVRVSSPNLNGISYTYTPTTPGFRPFIDIFAIPAGSTPVYPLPAPILLGAPAVGFNGYLTNRPESDYLIRVVSPSSQAFASLEFNIAPDVTPPVIGLASANPTSGTIPVDSATFLFAGSAVEAPYLNSTLNVASRLNRVEWRVDGGPLNNAALATTADNTGTIVKGDWTTSVTVTPGVHLFEARAVDGAGNPSPWVEATFARSGVADSLPPSVTVEAAAPTSGPVAVDSSTFDFSGFASDGAVIPIPAERTSGLVRIDYRIDGGAASTATLSTFWDPDAQFSLGTWTARAVVGPGVHSFEARAVDAAGNLSPWSAPVVFTRSTPIVTSEPREATTRDEQSFGVDDAAGTGWIGGTYYVDQASLEYDGAVFGPGRRAYKLDSRGWPINVVYDLATGSVTGLLSLPRR